MPNIAQVLKEEITRLARKELRGESAALKKASTQYRSDIANLKRQVAALEKVVRKLSKTSRGAESEEPGGSEDSDAPKFRFSAAGFAKQRARLGLSAAQAGFLLNCSGQSVYKWEQGKVRPRANQLPAIAALRKLSKVQAAALVQRS